MSETFDGDEERILEFVLALENRRVAKAMRAAGMPKQEQKRGWALLNDLTAARMIGVRKIEPDPALIAAMEAWRSKWFPVVRETLAHGSPDVFRWLVGDPSHADLDVVGMLAAFIERYVSLAHPQVGGVEGLDALRKLADRGLRPEVVQEANSLWHRLFGLDRPQEQVDESLQEEQIATAEAAARRWYHRWSQVALERIANAELLRALGLSPSAGQANRGAP